MDGTQRTSNQQLMQLFLSISLTFSSRRCFFAISLFFQLFFILFSEHGTHGLEAQKVLA
jgi:hypothetical protein